MHRSTYPRSSCRPAVTIRCAGAPASLPRRAVRAALSLLALAVAAACSEGRAAGHDLLDATLRFEGSASSLEELGRRALSALSEGDVAALEAVRLTEHEHNEVVWPELPASAPEVNFPVDFAWSNIEARNGSALRRILPVYEGEQLVFHEVECRGETRSFQTFLVRTDCWVIFGRAGSAGAWEARLFEDVLVRGGGHKIFRYYDEEPRRYHGGAGAAEATPAAFVPSGLGREERGARTAP